MRADRKWAPGQCEVGQVGKKQSRGPEGHEGRPESQVNVSRRKGSVIQDAADDVKEEEIRVDHWIWQPGGHLAVISF